MTARWCENLPRSGDDGGGDKGQDQAELTSAERAELERLRAEIAALRAERERPAAGRPVIDRAGRGRWRTVVAIL